MNQICIRRPNVSKSGCAQSQTKINVVETDAQIDFVESPRLIENFLANQKASARDSRAVLLEHRPIKIARMPARNVDKGVTRHATQSQNYPAMLQGPVRIPKPGSDCTHLRLHPVADHLPKPAWIIDLGVVVQEQKH